MRKMPLDFKADPEAALCEALQYLLEDMKILSRARTVRQGQDNAHGADRPNRSEHPLAPES